MTNHKDVVDAFSAYGRENGRASALSTALQLVTFCLVLPHKFTAASDEEKQAIYDDHERRLLDVLQPMLDAAGMTRSDQKPKGPVN